jgi:hypothetical protein
MSDEKKSAAPKSEEEFIPLRLARIKRLRDDFAGSYQALFQVDVDSSIKFKHFLLDLEKLLKDIDAKINKISNLRTQCQRQPNNKPLLKALNSSWFGWTNDLYDNRTYALTEI